MPIFAHALPVVLPKALALLTTLRRCHPSFLQEKAVVIRNNLLFRTSVTDDCDGFTALADAPRDVKHAPHPLHEDPLPLQVHVSRVGVELEEVVERQKPLREVEGCRGFDIQRSRVAHLPLEEMAPRVVGRLGSVGDVLEGARPAVLALGAALHAGRGRVLAEGPLVHRSPDDARLGLDVEREHHRRVRAHIHSGDAREGPRRRPEASRHIPPDLRVAHVQTEKEVAEAGDKIRQQNCHPATTIRANPDARMVSDVRGQGLLGAAGVGIGKKPGSLDKIQLVPLKGVLPGGLGPRRRPSRPRFPVDVVDVAAHHAGHVHVPVGCARVRFFLLDFERLAHEQRVVRLRDATLLKLPGEMERGGARLCDDT